MAVAIGVDVGEGVAVVVGEVGQLTLKMLLKLSVMMVFSMLDTAPPSLDPSMATVMTNDDDDGNNDDDDDGNSDDDDDDDDKGKHNGMCDCKGNCDSIGNGIGNDIGNGNGNCMGRPAEATPTPTPERSMA